MASPVSRRGLPALPRGALHGAPEARPRALPGHETGTVSREDEVHVQIPQACNGVEVTPERPRGRVCPQPDVRSDLEQQVVSGEQEPPSLVVQDEVKI